MRRSLRALSMAVVVTMAVVLGGVSLTFPAPAGAAPGETWTAQTPSDSGGWLGITYGEGLFVAVSTNRAMTSPDGVTWTARSTPSGRWESVTYGDGLFVAVAASGTDRVMTSPDGVTWTARTPADTSAWKSVTYGNGVFVAVAFAGTTRVMTSPDGVTWTARTPADTSSWTSVTYGNGRFLAVSEGGTLKVMTSPDGITWTGYTGSSFYYGVAYGNGTFVAVGAEGRVRTSPTGATWTTRTSADASALWLSVVYGDGQFVAVAQGGTTRVMTSPDGVTWTGRTAAAASGWISVTHGNGVFAAVANSGTTQVMTSGTVGPSIVGSRSPVANGAGWNDTSVTVSFTCAGGTAPVSCPPSESLGEGAGQSVTGTVTDADSRSASATVSGINVDLTAPTVTPGAVSPAANGAGWHSGDVTVPWSCSDALSGLEAPCAATTTITGEGSGLTSSVTATDLAGNATTVASASVSIDRTAPMTSVSATPLWSNTDVDLTLTPSDNLSGVVETSYRIDGGPIETGLSPQVTGAGAHTVEYWSTDAAGNVEDTRSVSFGIDGTAPTIVGEVNPAPNGAGWNNTDVIVDWACGDGGGSGIASCSPAQSVTTEGPGQDISGTATDTAGSSTTGHVTVSIDKTVPTISANVPPTPASGWFTVPVPYSFTCTDPGGTAASGVASCTNADVLTADGPNRVATGIVVDAAGNEATAGVEVDIDATPPSITGNPTTAANGNGWHTGAVTIEWTCDDATSGVVACPADETITALGSTTVTRTVTDVAGNVSTAASVTVKIDDGTSTSITGTVTPALNPQGWANTPVTISFDCTAAAGVSSCTDDTTLSTEGAGQQVTGTVVDQADNTASTTVTVDIDLTDPVVTVEGPADGASYTIGAVPAATCATTDTLSGVATAASPTLTGGDGAGIGTITATCDGAIDNAGNTASATITYTVTPAVGTGSMTGQVTDADSGAPIAGATIRLYGPADPELFRLSNPILYSTVTDANGTYTLTGVPEGVYHLRAGKPGAYYGAWYPDPALVDANWETTIPMALVRGVDGTGTITGPSGPIAGATVRVVKDGQPTAKRVTTDANGNYTLTGIVAGTYAVRVTAYGFDVATSPDFTVTTSDAAVPSPDVELTPATATTGFTGTLTNQASGLPIAGAKIRLYLVGCTCGTNPVLTTTTNATGQWSLTNVPAGTYNLQIAGTGIGPSSYHPSSLTLTPGTGPGHLPLTVTPGTGTLTGTYTPGT